MTGIRTVIEGNPVDSEGTPVIMCPLLFFLFLVLGDNQLKTPFLLTEAGVPVCTQYTLIARRRFA